MVVRNGWRKDMVPFSEMVLLFGVVSTKIEKRGLNQPEVNLISAQVSLDRVRKFANMYCAKYCVKCLPIAEHTDEKTKHYQPNLVDFCKIWDKTPLVE
ncbi:hypothetical protein CCAL13119_07065 [Campylobacter sp. RM13119]|uniref:hypothetical protein n=1 Tax=Campylobacter californiensis TaxID=1032243 RepID=UPI0014731BBD|nr:hypothetical protein [Campylobacter sp. RM13119]MBE3606702.1 hypothetical protein [Campylobacter sp. RM13119]